MQQEPAIEKEQVHKHLGAEVENCGNSDHWNKEARLTCIAIILELLVYFLASSSL